MQPEGYILGNFPVSLHSVILQPKVQIITARNEVAARYCFHKRVSRILSTGAGHAWQGGAWHVWQGRGHVWQWGMHGGGGMCGGGRGGMHGRIPVGSVPSAAVAAGGACVPACIGQRGGVCIPACTGQGVSAQGGCLSRGVSAPVYAGIHPLPCGQND